MALAALSGATALASTPARAQAVHPTPVPAVGFSGPVWATATAGSTVYIGGEFTHAVVDGRAVRRAGLAAFDARSGALLDWAPAVDGRVAALAVHAGDVFVAGEFDHVGGVPRDSLARLDGTSGAVRPGWQYRIWGRPAALAVGHGRLYLGGLLSLVGRHERAGLVAFDLATGAVDTGWAASANARVEALAVAPDRVYLAGRFWRINDVRGSRRVAAVHPVTGALLPGFRAEDAAERGYGIAWAPEGVYVAHGGVGGRVRAYDHSGRTRWELTTDGDPTAVARLGGAVYLGGHFDAVCRTNRVGDHGACLDGAEPRGKLAAASPDDGSLLPWRADGNGVAGVRAMAANPGRGELAVGGEFTTINGAVHRRFALFRAAGPAG